MGESGYYPSGAEHDPNAPWNQRDTEEREFSVTVSQTLSKNTKVYTNDYIPGEQFEEKEWDGDGYCSVTYQEPDDTSETNWKEAYKIEHDTPLHLLSLFKRVLEGDIRLEELKENRKNYLIQECSNWIEDDFEVCEN
jgi:hypothetical protein